MSSASGCEHELGWPSGVWGVHVVPAGVGLVCGQAGTQVGAGHAYAHPRACTRSHTHRLSLSSCVSFGVPRAWRLCSKEVTAKRKGQASGAEGPPPADPQTPGHIPHPQQRQGKKPKDMGAEAKETTVTVSSQGQDSCGHSPAPAPHRPAMPPAERPRHSPLPSPSGTGPQVP